MLPLILAVFFTSGFAALLYQVSWQRLLVIFSGADVYSATIIVAAYMAGLGVGSLAGGHLADRVTARASLGMFAIAELAVAAFGFSSTTLYYDVLYQRFGHVDISPAAMASLLFASLLWPTFFMGASLPLLARAMTASVQRAAAMVGALYGINTLGAAVGALVSTWVLLPRFGLEGSVRVGAVLNVACAIAMIPLALRFRNDTTTSSSQPASSAFALPVTADKPAFWFWALIYGISGLIALSLEIVWFRLLGVMMKSTAFTFGTLLALYLAGLGVGAMIGSAIAARVRRPAATFFALQAAVGLCATGLLALVVAASEDVAWLHQYFASYEPLSVPMAVDSLRLVVRGGATPESTALAASFLRLYVGVPALLVLPATLLMGCSFPVLQRVVQTDLAHIGRRVGVLLLANVTGSMLGAMLTGWVLLDRLGTSGVLKLLTVASGVFALLAMITAFRGHDASAPRAAKRTALAAATFVLVTFVMFGVPDAASLWAAVHGTTPNAMVFGEDGSGLSVLKTRQEGFEGRVVVYVNGLGQSTMPYGDIHTALGAIPALIHPRPRTAAVIGLGSGDTVYAVAGRREIERIVAIEIVRPQLLTLRALRHRHPYRGLTALLADGRIQHAFGDGRIHLRRAERTYDIIEADALRPGSAYSGNLYSEEYFRLVGDHLNPGGLAATWAPTARVHNAFIRAFPYVMSLPGLMVGSNDPIALDREAVAARMGDAAVRDHYEAAGISIDQLLQPYLAEPTWFGPEFDRRTLTDFNTDLFPRDEYDLTQR